MRSVRRPVRRRRPPLSGDPRPPSAHAGSCPARARSPGSPGSPRGTDQPLTDDQEAAQPEHRGEDPRPPTRTRRAATRGVDLGRRERRLGPHVATAGRGRRHPHGDGVGERRGFRGRRRRGGRSRRTLPPRQGVRGRRPESRSRCSAGRPRPGRGRSRRRAAARRRRSARRTRRRTGRLLGHEQVHRHRVARAQAQVGRRGLGHQHLERVVVARCATGDDDGMDQIRGRPAPPTIET